LSFQVPEFSQPTPYGQFGMRCIRRRDARTWREVRRRNADWLLPWEATIPPESTEVIPTFAQMVTRLRADARSGRALPFVMTLDGDLIGQLTVGGITWGSMRSAHIGYWVDQRQAGRGFTPLGVALACDFCFGALKLHRIEIVIRPENAASLRVPRKLGFRYEGRRPAFLHIDGDWRDHEVFAMHSDEAGPGLTARWLTRHVTGQ
jgi:[ribosomal protein S5]-alanine N-acetyltransferase